MWWAGRRKQECPSANDGHPSEVPASAYFQPGSAGWTVSTVTVRRDQRLDSDKVGELDPLVPLEVLEVGEGRRIKVRCCNGLDLEGRAMGVEGWVSCQTRSGEQLVARPADVDGEMV
ncbi:unnamed protein product [Prorocentrum cordatum]|uniref:Uncharacterized protein n=1 Tax=Prorocentrum cordatum TaxID=2364126 RepID=A0ABN9SRW2_9DINO|nr:unnamed protein product [Polarella glacialis]